MSFPSGPKSSSAHSLSSLKPTLFLSIMAKTTIQRINTMIDNEWITISAIFMHLKTLAIFVNRMIKINLYKELNHKIWVFLSQINFLNIWLQNPIKIISRKIFTTVYQKLLPKGLTFYSIEVFQRQYYLKKSWKMIIYSWNIFCFRIEQKNYKL